MKFEPRGNPFMVDAAIEFDSYSRERERERDKIQLEKVFRVLGGISYTCRFYVALSRNGAKSRDDESSNIEILLYRSVKYKCINEESSRESVYPTRSLRNILNDFYLFYLQI